MTNLSRGVSVRSLETITASNRRITRLVAENGHPRLEFLGVGELDLHNIRSSCGKRGGAGFEVKLPIAQERLAVTKAKNARSFGR